MNKVVSSYFLTIAGLGLLAVGLYFIIAFILGYNAYYRYQVQ